MTDGLHREDGRLRYYKDGEPCHAGVVKIDDKLYYIGKGGYAVKGSHVVHGEMTNGLLERGTYTFGDDYVLTEGSFVPPRVVRKRCKRRKRRAPDRQWTKKTKQRVVAIAASLSLLIAAVIGIGVYESHQSRSPAPSGTGGRLVLPTFSDEVELCSSAAKSYFDGNIGLAAAVQGGDPYRPFVFEYVLRDTDGQLRLSESPDFTDTAVYLLDADNTSLTVNNLKVNTTYYYAVDADGETHQGEFQTAASHRFVYIPNVYNTRDIGGYTTLDGHIVKQGLLIRGTELDGLVEATYFLNAEDVAAVQEDFGFVYDLDLRSHTLYPAEYTSRLGDDVTHRFFSAPCYAQVFHDEFKPAVKNVFSALADKSNYPMYLHCTYGADRTGTIVFLLMGLLNVSEEDMLEEYRLTAFHNARFIDNASMEALIAGLEPYEGDTLQEKIETFLTTDIGVTKAQIASIRSIYLEP